MTTAATVLFCEIVWSAISETPVPVCVSVRVCVRARVCVCVCVRACVCVCVCDVHRAFVACLCFGSSFNALRRSAIAAAYRPTFL